MKHTLHFHDTIKYIETADRCVGCIQNKMKVSCLTKRYRGRGENKKRKVLIFDECCNEDCVHLFALLPPEIIVLVLRHLLLVDSTTWGFVWNNVVQRSKCSALSFVSSCKHVWNTIHDIGIETYRELYARSKTTIRCTNLRHQTPFTQQLLSESNSKWQLRLLQKASDSYVCRYSGDGNGNTYKMFNKELKHSVRYNEAHLRSGFEGCHLLAPAAGVPVVFTSNITEEGCLYISTKHFELETNDTILLQELPETDIKCMRSAKDGSAVAFIYKHQTCNLCKVMMWMPGRSLMMAQLPPFGLDLTYPLMCPSFLWFQGEKLIVAFSTHAIYYDTQTSLVVPYDTDRVFENASFMFVTYIVSERRLKIDNTSQQWPGLLLSCSSSACGKQCISMSIHLCLVDRFVSSIHFEHKRLPSTIVL
mgnify:CR=1 FL=1